MGVRPAACVCAAGGASLDCMHGSEFFLRPRGWHLALV